MKIKIVKNQMGKTAEEIKPFTVIGPVPDDCILLNECEFKDVNRDKIISLAREYVENVECTCAPDPVDNCFVCWHCLFEYNLNFIGK